MILNHLYYIIFLKNERRKAMADKEKHPQIGAKIKELREKNGMEQLELATKMGYKSQSTISKWESGVNLPTGKKLIELARLLNTTTNVILGIEKDDPDTFTTPDGKEIDLSNLREKVVLFDGKPLSDDDVRKISQIIKLSLGVTDLEDR